MTDTSGITPAGFITTVEEVAVDVHLLKVESPTIHRFPPNLRRIGRESDYIAPRTVALGPYYHGAPQLEAMEEVKRVAVGYFFKGLSDGSREEADKKIIPIARTVRGCYADAGALAGIATDDEFAAMMFVDGCFLVQFMADTMLPSRGRKASGLRSMIHPYVVKPLSMAQVASFLATNLSPTSWSAESSGVARIDESYKPSLLLCLIQSYSAGRSQRFRVDRGLSGRTRMKLSTCAEELAEMGIKLRASKTTAKFSDMAVVTGPIFAQLSLVPLHLDSTMACWLVNMAGFEMYTETVWTGDCTVNLYLVVIVVLMTREEDVREPQANGIVEGSGDQHVLDFFQGLSPSLCTGQAYRRTIKDLEEYKQKRWLWIAVYRFLYNNAKTIATVLPIFGMLVGIFKTLLSLKLKQH